MKIAVASCWKYRDAWRPFIDLMCKFWRDRPYNAVLISDEYDDNREFIEGIDTPPVFLTRGKSWSQGLAEYAALETEPILLMQEDFFINAPVQEDLIQHGLRQLKERKAAMVRLYPCPGGELEYGDQFYAEIPKGSDYRVSCQATIWRPDVLHKIAFCCDSPADFEIRGSKVSNEFDEPFLAFKRDVQPWPISYLCSAIGRGLWSHDAKKLCDLHGIEVEWSRRGFQPA